MDSFQNQLGQLWFWWKERFWELIPRRRGGGAVNAQKIYILDEDVNASPAKNSDQSDVSPLIEILSDSHKSKQDIELRLPNHLCFTKTQTLPMAAKSRIRQILSTGLASNTVLDVSDRDSYLTSWSATASPEQISERFNANLFVLKRQLIDKIFGVAKQAKFDLTAIMVKHNGEQSNILANLDHPNLIRQQTIKKGLIAFLTIILISGMSGTASHIQSRQEQALNDLDRLLDAASSRAKFARQKIDARNLVLHELSGLRKAKGGQHSMHEVLEQVTGALPDNVWLTELRLKGKNVGLSGFATSAAEIIKPLETLSAFSNVKFTAPIVRSAQYDKERFSVQILTGDVNKVGDDSE